MRPSPEDPRSEELSFGADSGDGPRPSERAAAWARARRRPLTAVGLSVALAAGLGVSGLHLYGKSGRPLPPPDGPWPQTGSFLVHVCRKDSSFENCGNLAATEDDRRRIEETLSGIPEVDDFRRTTPEEAVAVARQDLRIGDVVTEDLLSDTFGGTLAGGDWRRALGEILRLPGVAAVEAYRDDFWWGKADISIRLCPEEQLFTDRCDGRGRADEADKRAVLERIRKLPGVEAVYFEDSTHALRVMRHAQWLEPPEHFDGSHMPEAFHVKFTGSWEFSWIAATFGALPGVAKVTRDVGPWWTTSRTGERG